ncbi:hypothetical protein [Pseudomonas panipatensis]|uniref:hypothetical protein n=1 Tax=Pseudomonas panipatensis TaxID=428992 RepID=UPI0035B397EB
MNLPAEHLPALPQPHPSLARLAGQPPREEPQSLVMAVELGMLAQRWRHCWPGLRLTLPQGGTWPLHTWPDALHEALDRLIEGAIQARESTAIALGLHLERGGLRIDVNGVDEQARGWLPAATQAARQLAAWQGGRLLWRSGSDGWKLRLSLPLSPARR